jgi:hypothetical protein
MKILSSPSSGSKSVGVDNHPRVIMLLLFFYQRLGIVRLPVVFARTAFEKEQGNHFSSEIMNSLLIYTIYSQCLFRRDIYWTFGSMNLHPRIIYSLLRTLDLSGIFIAVHQLYWSFTACFSIDSRWILRTVSSTPLTVTKDLSLENEFISIKSYYIIIVNFYIIREKVVINC